MPSTRSIIHFWLPPFTRLERRELRLQLRKRRRVRRLRLLLYVIELPLEGSCHIRYTARAWPLHPSHLYLIEPLLDGGELREFRLEECVALDALCLVLRATGGAEEGGGLRMGWDGCDVWLWWMDGCGGGGGGRVVAEVGTRRLL